MTGLTPTMVLEDELHAHLRLTDGQRALLERHYGRPAARAAAAFCAGLRTIGLKSSPRERNLIRANRRSWRSPSRARRHGRPRGR